MRRWWQGIVFGVVVLGFLAYAFRLSVALPPDQRAMPFATMATGTALFAVAYLTYLLERRSYTAHHEPSLGILWKEHAMHPSTEGDTGQEQDVYAEYIMWNAGDVPILILQPSRVLDRRLLTRSFGTGRVEVARVQQGETVAEKAFPIVLGKGETCIWRQFTGDRSQFRPTMAETVNDSQEKATSFLQNQNGDRRFLYAVLYFAKPPAKVAKTDIRKQYVGFCYKIDK
ncbi:MAG: hypothetical protein PHF77_01240 [Candidatus Bipolaricaulis anaerobius]|nr:hypothetical protein [Candidatus Bipolaricaulis anaerobius]